MANGRNRVGRKDSGRDAGPFVALPWSVLDSPAFARLSMHARALLLEVARQYVRDNNGRLLLSRAYMMTRGWRSADMLSKAKQELLDGGFIHQTVQGHRPNKASWYALTWQSLDRLPGYDPGAIETFERSAYRKEAPLKSKVLRPPDGTDNQRIGPPHGTGAAASVPPCGPVRATSSTPPVPPAGHHLEVPSVSQNQPTEESKHVCTGAAN